MTTINQNLKQFPQWLWLVPILLFTTIMVMTHITTDAYWGDEAVTLRSIGVSPYPTRPIDEIIFEVGVTHWPPAYFFGVAAWGNLVGWSEFSTRVLGLFIGLLSVSAIYRLGLTLFDKRIGILSAILLGSSVYFVFYAHELRGYILYIFLTIACIYLYWKLTHQTTLSRQTVLYFIISSAILMYTHYLAIFVVITIGLYHVFFARQVKNWENIFFSFILIGISYLPWLFIGILSAYSVSKWQEGLSSQVIITTMLSSYNNSLWFIAIPLLISSLVFYRNRATKMLWFMGVIFTTLCLAVHTLSPFIFNVRHVIGILPIMAVLIAVGLTHLPYYNKLITAGVLIIWVFMGIWLNRDLSYMITLPGEMAIMAIETMEYTTSITDTCVQPKDTILTHMMNRSRWNENVFEYYLGSPDNRYNLATVDFMFPLDNLHTEPDFNISYEEYFDQLTGDAPHTWVFVSPDADSASELEQVSSLLADQYVYCQQIIENDYLRGYLYQNSPDMTCQSDLISTQTLTSCDTSLLLQK